MSWLPLDTTWLKRAPRFDQVVGADASSLTIGPFTGRSVRAIACEYWIRNVGSSAVDYYVQPNAVFGDSPCHSLRFSGAGGQDDAATWFVEFNSSFDFTSGLFFVSTELEMFEEGGAAATFWRRFESIGGSANIPPVFNSVRTQYGAGLWDNLVDDLDTLDVLCRQAGTANPHVGIGQGSVFKIWELR